MKLKRVSSKLLLLLLLLVSCVGIFSGYENWVSISSLTTMLFLIATIGMYVVTRNPRLRGYCMMAVFCLLGKVTVDRLPDRNPLQIIYNLLILVYYFKFRIWDEMHLEKEGH